MQHLASGGLHNPFSTGKGSTTRASGNVDQEEPETACEQEQRVAAAGWGVAVEGRPDSKQTKSWAETNPVAGRGPVGPTAGSYRLCLGYLQLLFSGSTSKEIIFPTCIMWVFLESSDGYCLKSWVQGTPTTLASEPMVHSANYQTLRDWYIISFTVTPFSVLVTMCHGCNTYSVERADFHF